jgi:hypothetical protein
MTVKPMRMIAINVNSTEGLFTVGAIPVQLYCNQVGWLSFTLACFHTPVPSDKHVTLTTGKAPNAIPVHGDFLTNIFYYALAQHQAYFV